MIQPPLAVQPAPLENCELMPPAVHAAKEPGRLLHYTQIAILLLFLLALFAWRVWIGGTVATPLSYLPQ